mgnify:CR=1 FL=1
MHIIIHVIITDMNTKSYFSTRRTVRSYSDKEITDNLLNDMIEQASHAPTTGNMQLYSVIITRDPEMKRRLSPAHFNQPSVCAADVVLTFCADFNRFDRWCQARDAKPGYENFQSFMSAVLDTTIFAQQFVTIAELNGLGTCYLGTCLYNAPEIAALLKLPRLTVPVACISVGYPAEQPEETERLALDGVLYRETYPELKDTDIVEIYKAKDDFAPNARFVAENGKKTLAQVFTDVRYPRAMNEATSAKLMAFLRAQGFLDA